MPFTGLYISENPELPYPLMCGRVQLRSPLLLMYTSSLLLYLHDLYNKTQGEMDRLNLRGRARILKGGGAETSHRRQLYVYRTVCNRIYSSIIRLGNYENCESKERLRSTQLNTFWSFHYKYHSPLYPTLNLYTTEKSRLLF